MLELCCGANKGKKKQEKKQPAKNKCPGFCCCRYTANAAQKKIWRCVSQAAKANCGIDKERQCFAKVIDQTTWQTTC